ncbi:hypothetical protein HDU82_007985 [Entophlyctis luteolus]|nr:hypothetical protein HDU82_007985 [Entophlyctis luteolus]
MPDADAAVAFRPPAPAPAPTRGPAPAAASLADEAAAERLALELSNFRFASDASSSSDADLDIDIALDLDLDRDRALPARPRPRTPTQLRPLSRTQSRARSLSLNLSLGPNQENQEQPPTQPQRIPVKKKRVLKVDEATAASMRTRTPTPTPMATPVPASTPVPAVPRPATASLPRVPQSLHMPQQKLAPVRFSSLGLLLENHATSTMPVATKPVPTLMRDRMPLFVIPPPPAFSPPILSPPIESPVPPPHLPVTPPPTTLTNDLPEFSSPAVRVRPQRRDSIKYSKSGSLPLSTSAIAQANTQTPQSKYNFLTKRRTVSEYSAEIDTHQLDIPTRNNQTTTNTIANSGPVFQSFDSRLVTSSFPSWENQQIDASEEAYFRSLPRKFTPSAPVRPRALTSQDARTFTPLPSSGDFQLPKNFVPIPTDEYYLPVQPATPARDVPAPRMHNSHPSIVVPRRSESIAMLAPLPSPTGNISAMDTGLPPAWIPPQASRPQVYTPVMQPPPFDTTTLTRHGGKGTAVQRLSRRASVPENMHESLPRRGKGLFARVGGITGGALGRAAEPGGVPQYEPASSSGTSSMSSDTVVRSDNAIAVAFSLGVDTEMYEMARERLAANARERELESDYLDTVMASFFRSKSRSRLLG